MNDALPFPDVLARRPREVLPVTATYVRDLEEKDILSVFTQPIGRGTPALKRITDSHHNLARLLASGMSPIEVSKVTGRAPSTISSLQTDPAFQQLLSHYREIKDELFADVQAQMAAVGSTALTRLQEILEDDEVQLEPDQLRKIVETTMDRTGNGPSKTIKKQSAGEFIKELVEAANKERVGRIIPKAL